MLALPGETKVKRLCARSGPIHTIELTVLILLPIAGIVLIGNITTDLGQDIL
jgi:hypothetical protein